MDCAQARQKLPPYLDGELDAADARQLEQHLGSCTACAELAARQRTLGNDLRQAIRLESPAGLRERILAQADASTRPATRPRRVRMPALAWFAAAACLAIGWFLSHWWYQPTSGDLLVHDLVAAHVRSLLPGHLTDVQSSDHHTVKPWYAGKLDYAPWVEDLAAEGFPLVGGRIDFIAGQRVAVLVYQRRQHVIDLMVSPRESGTEHSPITTDEGYHLLSWELQGQRFTAISDVNPAELATFAAAVRASVTNGTGQ